MPVYTYQCDNCGLRFERKQKFTDPAITRCPECSKKTLRKVYSPVGIVFKGSGFYATDHRSPSGASFNRSNDSAKTNEPEKTHETEKKSETSKPSTADKADKADKADNSD
jgi:putative FmdB family regulatory protein